MQKKVAEKIKSGALIVDVRTVSEYKDGHYPNALHIPVTEIENRLNEFGDKNRCIIVYCASGGRSGKAVLMLNKHGYKDVINAGGLSDIPKI